MFSVEEKVVFITGGTSGIGLAAAERFAKAGAKVAICGRRNASRIAEGLGVYFNQMDITKEEQFIEALENTSRELGNVDCLINNAGIQDTGLGIEDHSMECLEKNISVLLKGPYIGIKHGPGYINDGGVIINTASIAAFIGLYGYGQYSLCKAALLQLTRTAAMELASRNIRVNAVSPGTVRTPMIDDQPEEIALTTIATPLRRIAETRDLVGVYHFLASDEAAYITGQNIVVDGGLSAGFCNELLEKILS